MLPSSRLVRRLVFTFLPLCCCILVCEITLGVSGFQGNPDRQVSWCREHAGLEPPFLPAMPLDGQASVYRAPALPAHPRPFPVEKSAEQRRIFVLGGSAAHGYGFSRNGSFSGRLQEMLAPAWPELDIQVINLGCIAFSSQQLLAVAKDVLATAKPDLFLVYSGNNELLEWWDWRKYLPVSAHRVFLANLRWNRRLAMFRSFLFLRDLVLASGARAWGATSYSDDVALDWSRRARLSESVREYARETFHYNIGRIIDEARKAGVPVVLSTVAANWMDQPGQFPFQGEGPGEPERNMERLDLADMALSRGDVQEPELLFRQAFKEWPEAITHWRWGDMYRRYGQVSLAREHLRQAIVLDENPHRVLPRVNDEIRRMAEQRSVPLVDGEAVVASRSADGIIGFEQVYDHCHPDLASHWLLASAFAGVITQQVWQGSRPVDFQAMAAAGIAELERRGADSQRVESWLGVDLEDGSADYARDPQAEYRDRFVAALADARERGQDAAAWNRAGLLAYHGFHADCPKGGLPCLQDALDAFREALALDPAFCAAQANIARLLLDLGRRREGLERLLAALDCDPMQDADRSLAERVAGRP